MSYQIINNVNGVPIIATGEFPFVPMDPGVDNNSQVRVMEKDPVLSNVMPIDPADVTE
jgi:hypothetical protein